VRGQADKKVMAEDLLGPLAGQGNSLIHIQYNDVP
jgi:hypothetical protein